MTVSDSARLASWRERWNKFKSSGLTVSAYCHREGISTARFYYWSRRLRQAGAIDAELPTSSPAACQEATSHAVEVFIGDQVRVSIPASAPELVASVLASLQASPIRSGRFQQIELGNHSAARR